MDYTEIVSHMSIREKARLVTGADFWHTWGPVKYGMPSIMVSDGPTGLRKMEGAKTITSVCFPSAVALSSSWDRGVLAHVGQTLADECIAKRVSVLLGPGINIKRSPLCGRNFEYYSEDPVLAGECAAAIINGVQSKGVGTSLKHFAANSTEVRRMVSNSLVDDRALREIYLRGFEIAVKKAQPWTVMLAYNKINGLHCTENSNLVNGILRDEWGFKGLTVSDWMATGNRVEGLRCGLDLEMPGSGYVNVRRIAKAYRDGELKEADLNTAAQRVAELVNKAEPLLKKPAPALDLDKDHETARLVAEQCPVLLKNEGALPVRPGQKIAVIGKRAEEPLYQGGGSAQINSYKVENILDCFKNNNDNFVYAPGYDIANEDKANKALINEAVAAAQGADVALVFVSCALVDACEGVDRQSMSIPANQNALIEAVCAANPNTAVIVTSGACVEMPWVNLPRSIMQTHLLGEAGGRAIYNLLTGRANPSGKLSETYPVSYSDTACPENYQTDENNNLIYKESIFVGYRYYEKANVPVLFPFGHGLSYTSFGYSNISLSSNQITPDDKLTVSFTVSNTGAIGGAEVSQVYVGLKDSLVYRAPKELKEFSKVFLNAGESKTITVELDRSAFEYYSPSLRAWVVEGGTYDIFVGASSKDIRLTATVDVVSNEANGELDYMTAAPKYFSGDIKNVGTEDFVDIFGAYPEDFIVRNDDRFTADACLDEVKDTKVGKKIVPLLGFSIMTIFSKDPLMSSILYGSLITIPFKNFVAVSKGLVSDQMVDGIVHLFNSGRFLESLQVMATGIPDSVLNIVEPLVRNTIDKKSRK